MWDYLELRRLVHLRYRGLRLNDGLMYLACRKEIANGFLPHHHLRLKAYYRIQFLKGASR